MKPSSKIDLPILKDIVVPGKDVPATDELPAVLNEIQVKTLQQQIDNIIQTQLEASIKKATEQAVKDIKAYLNKELPKLIKAANE
ncbi:hypothetical protein BGP_4302 [Beggiatoa sp. PS]|nr:hypothetical protein BGP_4302 [Beggiatoa sp. PS]